MKKTLGLLMIAVVGSSGCSGDDKPAPYEALPVVNSALGMQIEYSPEKGSFHQDPQGQLADYGGPIKAKVTDTAGNLMVKSCDGEVLVVADPGPPDRPNKPKGDDVFFGNTDGSEVFRPDQERMGVVNDLRAPVWGHPLLFRMTTDETGCFSIDFGTTRARGQNEADGWFSLYDNHSFIAPVLVIVRVRRGENLYLYKGGVLTAVTPLSVNDPRFAIQLRPLSDEDSATKFRYWFARWQEENNPPQAAGQSDLLVGMPDKFDRLSIPWSGESCSANSGIWPCGRGASSRDVDNDGVSDCLDPCPHDPGSVSFPCLPWGDADADGDVDQEDFGQWQLCFGQEVSVAEGCRLWDGDHDGVVGAGDYQMFVSCFSGASLPSPCLASQ